MIESGDSARGDQFAAAPFTRERIVAALHELGARAWARGLVTDLAIYRGSCLPLVSNFRIATRDVDAVALRDQAIVNELAEDVAAALGLPASWLNDGVRTYLSPAVDAPAQHELFATYPSETQPGLRVFVPTAAYVLAMKLMALRIDPAAETQDLPDILALLDVVGLRTRDDLVAFAARFYPEARVSGKLHLAIDTIWREHQRRRQKDRPYFPTPIEDLKAMLSAQSPLAFRRRLIFVEAEPLRRATFPRG